MPLGLRYLLTGTSGVVGGFFDPGTGRVLNHATLTDLLHGLGIDAIAHGFRCALRD